MDSAGELQVYTNQNNMNKFFEIVRAEEQRLIDNGKIDSSTSNGRAIGLADAMLCAAKEIVGGHRNMEEFKDYWADAGFDFIVFTKRSYKLDNYMVNDFLEFCKYFEFDPFN